MSCVTTTSMMWSYLFGLSLFYEFTNGGNVGIIGGENAKKGEFPWIVSIRQLKDLGFTHYCGGSIVAENWVVTAAHCCKGQSRFSISAVAGGVDLDIVEFEEQRKNIEKIIPHEDFNFDNLTSDICLLKTSSSFKWTEWVQPVKLPVKNEEYDQGMNGTVAGWGQTDDILPFLPEHLKKVSVPVMNDDDCFRIYNDTDLNEHVVDSMICIQNPSDHYLGTCRGDSGGPYTRDSDLSLVGLVSWGEGGCAATGYPSVLTQVSYFIDWIMDKMATE